ncbi:MAG: ComF family protein [Candidatus Cryptobacteroides sp.]|jgi:Predicted amidophosphoribosyltransferases
MSDKFNYNIQRRIDADDKLGPHKYSFACALFFYSSASGYKEITKSLKYNNNLNSGRFFSIMLGCALASSVLFSDIDLVMPVPLHFSRKWHRGYNQAQIVAKEVAEMLSARLVTSVLVRSSRTKSQTRLRVSDKYDNVKNAFRVNKMRLMEYVSSCDRGIHILLIDDVFTTGATLEACYYALSKSLSLLSVDNYRISVATLGFVC